MSIVEAAAKLRPGTAWNYNGTTLCQAEDGTPRVECPTMEELQAVMASDDYVEKRRSEYPTVGDQLDAIWKGGQAATEMKARVDAVKAKYPKPA